MSRLKKDVETPAVIQSLLGLKTKLDELGKKDEILKVFAGDVCNNLAVQSGAELDRFAARLEEDVATPNRAPSAPGAGPNAPAG